ncbi:MAG: hypothetical protein RIR01_2304 [Bacteroidota bacterium]|jgi:hypothetical protein
MKKEQESELFARAFLSMSKKKQTEFLMNLFETNNTSTKLVDYVLYKPLESNYGLRVGEYGLLELNASIYPSINKQYYVDKDLVIDHDKIKVKIERINVFDAYLWVEIYTNNNKKELVSVYESYIKPLPTLDEVISEAFDF